MTQNTQTIRSEAHHWYMQIESGDLTPAERQRFKAWLAADPKHKQAYQRAAQLWQDIATLDQQSLPAHVVKPLLRERFIAWLGAMRRHWLWHLGGAVAITATLVLLLQLAPLGWYAPWDDHFETTTAQLRHLTLDDGSQITLGAETQMSASIDETSRHITLHSGEAFFDVVTEVHRPFVIDTANGQVTVTGTAFELRLAAGGLRVSVVEGSVEVQPNQDTPARQLNAGQQVSIDEDGQLGETVAVDISKLGAWRRNLLVYIGAPLSEIVADINRYQAGWIVISDQQTANLKVTASFETNDIDAMFATLTEALPISVWQPFGGLTVISGEAR